MCQVLDGGRASRRVRRIVRSRVAVLALIVCTIGVLTTAGEAAASGSISSSAVSERLVHAALHASAFRDGAELRSYYAGFESGSNAPSLSRHQSDAVAFGSFGSALVGSAPVQPGPAAVAVDTATDTIYVASGSNDNGPTSTNVDTVSVIDGRRCQALDVSHCKGPWPAIKVGLDPSTLAVDKATDTIYVTNIGDNTVSVINGATCNAHVKSGCDQTPATVPVGSLPVGIFADEANHTVYVANANPGGPGTVSMINSATCNGSDLKGCPSVPPPTVAVGPAPGDVDVNEVTHTVYVANIVGISAFVEDSCDATDQSGCSDVGEAVCTSVDPSCGPFAVAVDAANNTLYVADGFANSAPGIIVSVFDGRTCDASDLTGCATQTPGTVTIAPPEFFEVAIWLVLDTPLHTVYAVNQKDDTISAIDTNLCNGSHLSSCATLQPPTVHTGEDPESIALNPDTQTLYTANQVSNDVSVIDALRCNATVTNGCREAPSAVPLSGPGALVADPAVGTVYVATGTDTLSMIDSQTCNAFRHDGCTSAPPTVSVGAFPQGIAVDPETHTVYVADFGSGPTGSVSVLDARTCNATTTSSCETVQTLPVPGGNAVGVAVDTATNTVYVTTAPASGPNTVSVFNGATCDATQSSGCAQVPHSVTVGFGAAALAVDTLTDTVYVANFANFAGNTVSVFNGATCNAAGTSGLHQRAAEHHRRSGLHIPRRRRNRSGDRHDLRCRSRKRRGLRHRLGDQRRNLQRRHQRRLRPGSAERHGRVRPRRYRLRLREPQRRRREHRGHERLGHQCRELQRHHQLRVWRRPTEARGRSSTFRRRYRPDGRDDLHLERRRHGFGRPHDP